MKKILLCSTMTFLLFTAGNSQTIKLVGSRPSSSPCSTPMGNIMFAPIDTTPSRNVANNYKTWENGDVIKVKFLYGSGSPAIRQKIMQYAKEWEQYANITLQFVPDLEAITNIRIYLGSKMDSLGHNSSVGTDCNNQSQLFQTMNLDTSDFLDYDYYVAEIKNRGPFYTYLVNKGTNLNNYLYSDFYRDVILYPSADKRFIDKFMKGTTQHEFGHSLGLLHEQSYPGAIKWARDTVYKYYWERAKWDKEKVDFNVLEVSDQFFTNGTAYDPKSVMHYRVNAWQTLDGFSLEPSYEISEGDKKLVAALYPKNQKVSSLAVPKVIISNFTKLNVTKDEVRKMLIIRPSFQLKTGAVTAHAYYIARLTTEDGQNYLVTNKTLYSWNGMAATYMNKVLIPNSNISYNNGTLNKLELTFPYSQLPNMGGKKFRIQFTVYQDDAATGKMERLVTYSYSNPLALAQ
jgi:hypothetical protein